MTTKDTCNTCGCEFGEQGENAIRHASLKNRAFLASLDSDGNVIQECCEDCQQELLDSFDEYE